MAYNKHVWADGELITPQLMNNIENGLDDILSDNLLEALASSYDADNVYNNGDIVIYNNKMYKIIEDQVTGEWDEGKAEEIQIKLLINSETAPTRTEILRLSIANLVTLNNIAEPYDPSELYHTGDYVIYNNILYRFIADSSTSLPHEFDPSKVTQVTIMDTFKSIVGDSFGGIYDKTKSYNVGDYVIYNNKIYKCVQITTPDTFENNFEKFESTTLMEELIKINQIGIEAQQDALTAEAYACGTQDKTEITDQNHFAFKNNAKFYSDLISGDAGLVEAYTTGKYKGQDITSTDSGEYAGAFENNARYYYEHISSALETIYANSSEGYDNLIASIGDAFDSMAHPYHIGDYFVHEGRLYKCIADFTASSTWDEGDYSSYIEAVNIGNELQSNTNLINQEKSSIEEDITTINNNVSKLYSQKYYHLKDFCLKDKKLYRCNTTINSAETWTSNHWDEASLDEAINDIDYRLQQIDNEVFSYTLGGFILVKDDGVININKPNASEYWQYAVVPCNPGDTFTVTGYGTNTAHALWCFLNSEQQKIKKSKVNTDGYYAVDEVITAPPDSVYLVSNTNVNYKSFLCRNKSVNANFNEIFSHMEQTFTYNGLLKSTDDILNLNNGIYRKYSNSTPINWPENFPDGDPSTYGIILSFRDNNVNDYRILIYFPGRGSKPTRGANACFVKYVANGSWGEWLSVKLGSGKSAFNVSEEAIGSEFDSSNEYNINDYVLNDGNLYRFTSNHSGEWDINDVLQGKITSELDYLFKSISTLTYASGSPIECNNAITYKAYNISDTSSDVYVFKNNLIKNEIKVTANVKVYKDTTGVYVLDGSRSDGCYRTLGKIYLEAGKEYWIGGAPTMATSSSKCYFRLTKDDDIKKSPIYYSGSTYIPEESGIYDLRVQCPKNVIYDQEKFYPIITESSNIRKCSINNITTFNGNCEIIRTDYEPLEIIYHKRYEKEEEEEEELYDNFNFEQLNRYINSETGYINESFFITIEPKKATNGTIIGITSKHITGENYASIRIYIVDKDDNSLYASRMYELGSIIEPITQEFKAPPCVDKYKRIKLVFTIPEGTEIQLNNLYSYEAQQARHNDNIGIKWHAHTGFPSLMPTNTLASFQMAGKLGFNSCITIPQFTSDGVGVCFHGDDHNKIAGLLRYNDGTVIPEDSVDNKTLRELTYNDLLGYSAGYKKNSIFIDMKVPTLDQFFKTCSLYNMNPILSVHSTDNFSASTGREQFKYIKDLCIKWNVLSKLWIKSGNDGVQSAAFSTFHREIGGYILLRGQTSSWDPLAQAKRIHDTDGNYLLPSNAQSATEAGIPLVFELFLAAATDEAIKLGTDEGFIVSVATTNAGLTGPVMKSLIEKGVTEFTDDYHCSLGLDWMN